MFCEALLEVANGCSLPTVQTAECLKSNCGINYAYLDKIADLFKVTNNLAVNLGI